MTSAVKKKTYDTREAERLLGKGFKLVPLLKDTKQPIEDEWNKPENFVTQESFAPDVSGYGYPLKENGLCSIDPDNVDCARVGLAALGFDLEELMAAGVRTQSTRPRSGGRSTFKVSPDLTWIKFASRDPAVKTALELRASATNLQDCVPGVVYMSDEGDWCSQDYHVMSDYRIDNAPNLPEKVRAWWHRLSTDYRFKHDQQTKFFGAISDHLGREVEPIMSLSHGMYDAPGHRITFNKAHKVEAILARHDYEKVSAKRWKYIHGTGAPGLRPIPDTNDGLWQSDHGSDPLSGTFDAWIAYVVLDHGGDLEAAKEAWATECDKRTTENFEVLDPVQCSEQERIERREKQKKRNTRIGEGEERDYVPLPEIITLSEAESRFVFVSDGSQVADLHDPRFVLALPDWVNTFAASTQLTPKADGDGVKEVSITNLWKNSRKRRTVMARSFKPGAGLTITDPEGRESLNTWRDYDRDPNFIEQPEDGADLFFDQIDFLFGAEAPRFLLWLAHIEQEPGVLPHHGWLHVATEFGLGRNWVASVLTRLWAGSVAANVDLPEMLKRGFNGMLSRKVLAYVDEIHEGGGNTKWENNEKLKSAVTCDRRLINPKFGRQWVEYNACRWLMFSNHLAAIPIEKDDRRWNVVVTESRPRPPELYADMYQALENPRFIQAVAKRLASMDISNFKPGEHAHMTDSKRKVYEASMTESDEWAVDLVKHWPSDLIDHSALSLVLTGEEGKTRNASVRHVMARHGIVPMKRTIKMPDGGATKLVAIRNVDQWENAPNDLMIKEHSGASREKFDCSMSDDPWPRALILARSAEADHID